MTVTTLDVELDVTPSPTIKMAKKWNKRIGQPENPIPFGWLEAGRLTEMNGPG